MKIEDGVTYLHKDQWDKPYPPPDGVEILDGGEFVDVLNQLVNKTLGMVEEVDDEIGA